MKNKFFIFTFIFLFTTQCASMDIKYPMIPIDNNHQIINGTIEITDNPITTFYVQPQHNNTDIYARLGEPYMNVTIRTAKKNFNTFVPAKALYNFCKGSSLTLLIKNEILQLTYVAPANTINNNPIDKKYIDLAEETYKISLNSFYENAFTYNAPNSIKNQFEDAGITPKRSMYFITTSGDVLKKISYNHGPKGCPDEKSLINQIIEPRIENYDNNLFKYLIQRQYGAHNPFRKPQLTDFK